MRRRSMMSAAGLAGLGALLPSTARAHHGWSSFDQTRPLYLEGRALQVRWRNPHAELELELVTPLALPADLASRPVPAQAAPVDGRALLAAAALPKRTDRRWWVELAPLSRMEAWKIPEIRPSDRLAVLGFTFIGEKGEALLRAEYLFFGPAVYGLRSSPA